ncbi:hypothetical protein AYI68_g6033 [Smittium mucronatum]|uniref:Uncharacterized protein n=1 Tax=Smittium mucronatum TaxID=133383 RepID=A0A1R0GSK7_9FUNG|nr:hypothetical protein AYI68_g6033 [Smittium mucronatum]
MSSGGSSGREDVAVASRSPIDRFFPLPSAHLLLLMLYQITIRDPLRFVIRFAVIISQLHLPYFQSTISPITNRSQNYKPTAQIHVIAVPPLPLGGYAGTRNNSDSDYNIFW